MPRFVDFKYEATDGVITRKDPDRWNDTVLTIEYGAIADGGSHPLSTRYATLAAAQVDYPFATALTQEIDYCACKQASDVAFGPDGSEHGNNYKLNKRLLISNGQYYFGNDTWLIRNLVSGTITGYGKLTTLLTGNNTVLAFDGIWHSYLANFSVAALTNTATSAIELDGNIPGHPYPTRGVQNVTCQDLIINAGGSLYGLALTRLGNGGGGPGAQGDSCLFLNVHFQGASFANYYQIGFNALQNTFVCGDMQTYTKHGFYVNCGTINIYGFAFEPGTPYQNILNGGWDIYFDACSSLANNFVSGCRTEGYQFLKNNVGNFTEVRSCNQSCGVPAWTPLTAFTTNDVVIKQLIVGQQTGRMFAPTIGGISGAVEPVWPTDGTPIVDGSITWQEVFFDYIYVGRSGDIDQITCSQHYAGRVNGFTGGNSDWSTAINAEYTMLDGGPSTIYVDATAGPITVHTSPTWESFSSENLGKRFTICKIDTTANAVTISSSTLGFSPGVFTSVIPGGSKASRTYGLGFFQFAGLQMWQLLASA